MASQEEIRRNLEERIRLEKPIDWNLALKQQDDYLSHLIRLPKGNPANEDEIKKTYKVLDKILTGELIEGMEKRIKIKRSGEKIISRIFLENSHRFVGNCNLPDEAISMIELENNVEVFRFNLEGRPSPYLDNPDILRSEKFKNTIIYAGIMPKKEYSDLFNYLERRNVWEIDSHYQCMGVGVNSLFISKNQKKHAFEMDTYNLLNLDKKDRDTRRIDIERIKRNGELPKEISQDWKDANIKFLEISKEICDVSKKYAKTKINVHNNQNPYKNQ